LPVNFGAWGLVLYPLVYFAKTLPQFRADCRQNVINPHFG
jgi:hypothetical protein